MAEKLKGKKIAFLAASGFEESELLRPWEAIKDAGAEVELISLKEGEIQGTRHMEKGKALKVDKIVTEVSAKDYDGLVLPGGVFNPDQLRMNRDAVEFVRDFHDHKKPIAAICHGPWMLVEADIVDGRTITSWPSLKTDIQNAGGKWVDKEVQVDHGLITSRNPDDIDAFNREAIDEFSKDKQQQRVA